MKAGIAVDNRDDARNTPLHLAAGKTSWYNYQSQCTITHNLLRAANVKAAAKVPSAHVIANSADPVVHFKCAEPLFKCNKV